MTALRRALLSGASLGVLDLALTPSTPRIWIWSGDGPPPKREPRKASRTPRPSYPAFNLDDLALSDELNESINWLIGKEAA